MTIRRRVISLQTLGKRISVFAKGFCEGRGGAGKRNQSRQRNPWFVKQLRG
jgi:hypothetical protein